VAYGALFALAIAVNEGRRFANGEESKEETVHSSLVHLLFQHTRRRCLSVPPVLLETAI